MPLICCFFLEAEGVVSYDSYAGPLTNGDGFVQSADDTVACDGQTHDISPCLAFLHNLVFNV